MVAVTPLPQLALLLLLPAPAPPSGPGLVALTPVTPTPTTDAAGPALAVNFDPATWTLTWACDAGVTVTSCTATPGAGRRLLALPQGACSCRFKVMVLHRGVTLEVDAKMAAAERTESAAAGAGATARGKLRLVDAGVPGSGAENLTCEIREVRFLSCAWRAGPAAAGDVEYDLTVRDLTGHEVARCSAPPPRSGHDPARHCQAEGMELLQESRAYVAVTGRSRAGPTRFLDDMLVLKRIERLGPPVNVTSSCGPAHCTISWAPPPTWAPMSAPDFRFEVEWKSLEPGSEARKALLLEQTHFAIPGPAPHGRHEVRVRAGDVRTGRWGDWSPAHTFGSEESRVPAAFTYAASACAALLCALGLGAACGRWRRLFPPVPRIKDRVSDDERVNPETLRSDLARA